MLDCEVIRSLNNDLVKNNDFNLDIIRHQIVLEANRDDFQRGLNIWELENYNLSKLKNQNEHKVLLKYYLKIDGLGWIVYKMYPQITNMEVYYYMTLILSYMMCLGKCDKEKIKFIQKTILEEFEDLSDLERLELLKHVPENTTIEKLIEELSVIDEFGNRQAHEDLARLYFELVKIKERRFDMIIKV